MTNLFPKILILSPLLLLGAPAQQARAQCVMPPVDINGLWRANDGGAYNVRTVGSTVWWDGFSEADEGRSWSNVFRGTKSGTQISGEWADVSGHKGSGRLRLQVAAHDRIVRVGSSGSPFGGRTWTRPWPKGVRRGCADTAGEAVSE